MQQLARDEAGNVWEVDAQGNPVRLVEAAGQPPADPAFQYQGPQAAADLRRTEAQTTRDQISAEVARQTAPAEVAKALAEAEKLRAEIEKMSRGGTKSETERANAITGYQSALALEGIIADLEQKYLSGPGATSGLGSVMDYLPLEQNERFDKAANAARGIVGQALGFTGGQLNSAAEAQMNIGPYIPQSTDKDGTIEDSIQRLRDLQAQAMDRSVAILGGVPDAQGNIQPITRPMAAGAGATEAMEPLPEGFEQEYNAFVAGGNFTPEQYADFRAQLDRKYFGGDAVDKRETYLTEGENLRGYLDGGGRDIPPPSGVVQELSGLDQFRNNLAVNPLGAGAIGFADSMGFGGVRALAGDQFNALQEQQGIPMLAGQIGGAIGGTAALGRAGREIATRAAPNLLGGGGRAQFGRNLATDATYGGIYGGVSEGDPLTGAALGAVGSAGGQAVGGALGTAIGGARMSEAARRLKDRGVRMTVGRMSGDAGSRAEDLLASIPGAGNMVRARQLDSFQDFNRAAFEEAGAPIGVNPSAIGDVGVDQLQAGVSDAYKTATGGVAGPLDAQFAADMQAAIQQGQGLPPDLRRSLGEVLDARVNPINDAGQMTGVDYQQAMRALKGTRARPPQRFEGFEQDYRDAVTGSMDALTGQVERIGGPQVTQRLGQANTANRNMKILENAVKDRAKIGTQTGEVGVFLPSQLKAAVRQSGKKYGTSQGLETLANDAQAVLPSTVPNSGTTDRAMAAALGLGALGVGGGAEFATTGDADNTAKIAAALALLTAGGTRTGQRVLGDIVYSRPIPAQQVGNALRRRKGLFGSAAVPMAFNVNQ